MAKGRHSRHTRRTASRCAASKIAPAFALQYMALPTLPSRNMGPEVEHKTLMRPACAGVMEPLAARSAMMRLPTG